MMQTVREHESVQSIKLYSCLSFHEDPCLTIRVRPVFVRCSGRERVPSPQYRPIPTLFNHLVDRLQYDDYDSADLRDWERYPSVATNLIFMIRKTQLTVLICRSTVRRLRSQVAKATDCKSVIVSSTLTGAS